MNLGTTKHTSTCKTTLHSSEEALSPSPSAVVGRVAECVVHIAQRRQSEMIIFCKNIGREGVRSCLFFAVPTPTAICAKIVLSLMAARNSRVLRPCFCGFVVAASLLEFAARLYTETTATRQTRSLCFSIFHFLVCEGMGEERRAVTYSWLCQCVDFARPTVNDSTLKRCLAKSSRRGVRAFSIPKAPRKICDVF